MYICICIYISTLYSSYCGSPSQLTFWVTFTFCHQLAAEDLQRLVQLATGFGPTLVPGSVDPLMWKNPMNPNDSIREKTTKGGIWGHAKPYPKKVVTFIGCCWLLASWGYQNGLSNGIPEASRGQIPLGFVFAQVLLHSPSALLSGWCSGRSSEWPKIWRRLVSLDLAGLVALGTGSAKVIGICIYIYYI